MASLLLPIASIIAEEKEKRLSAVELANLKEKETLTSTARTLMDYTRTTARRLAPLAQIAAVVTLAWMTSFEALKRIDVECTGTYGSGLLRYLQNAGLEVLEVTAPDRMERRKRGKSVLRTEYISARRSPVTECKPANRRGSARTQKLKEVGIHWSHDK